MPRTACLIGTVLLTSGLAGHPALAVYALGFWHYLFYWWAYRHGAVQPAKFRRDAMLMKGIALASLASVYVAQPWHWTQPWPWISVLVIATGFMLNLIAARALGHTRTHYGWELGDPPRPRVTSFPYSVMPHPMLIGNMMAFGGTLLHPGFRRAWWPLAILHVALNGALIVMETTVAPKRRTERTGAAATTAGADTTAGVALVVLAAGILAVLAWAGGWGPAGWGLAGWGPAGSGPAGSGAVAIVAGASVAYGYAQRGWYVPAASPRAARIHDHDPSREAV